MFPNSCCKLNLKLFQSLDKIQVSFICKFTILEVLRLYYDILNYIIGSNVYRRRRLPNFEGLNSDITKEDILVQKDFTQNPL